MNEIKVNFEKLICCYPSGMDVNSLLAAKYFGLHRKHIVVGNGAAELIKSLMEKLHGKIGIIQPTFEEYANRRNSDDIVVYHPDNSNFAYNADDLINFYNERDISNLILINPDNPSGNYIKKSDVMKISKWAEEKKLSLL